MQTALNTLKLFGLDRLVDDAFHSEFALFIKQNHQLVSLLLETKSRNANFQTVQHKQLIQSSVSAALRLDEYLYSSSDTITNQLDYRCIRKFIFSWHHSNLEIRESIDSLEAHGIKFEVPLDWNLASPPSMVVERHAKHASVSLSSNSGSSPSATPPSKQAAVSTVSSHSIRPTSASSIGGRSDVVLKIRQVSTSAERATSDSFQVLTCIEKSFKDQDNTLPPSAKEGWESMRRQIRTCREQAMRLQRAIHALNQNIQFEESRNVKRLQLEAGTFIGGITSLTSLARNISKEFQFDKDSLAGLQALTRSTKNLALALKAAAEDAI